MSQGSSREYGIRTIKRCADDVTGRHFGDQLTIIKIVIFDDKNVYFSVHMYFIYRTDIVLQFQVYCLYIILNL